MARLSEAQRQILINWVPVGGLILVLFAFLQSLAGTVLLWLFIDVLMRADCLGSTIILLTAGLLGMAAMIRLCWIILKYRCVNKTTRNSADTELKITIIFLLLTVGINFVGTFYSLISLAHPFTGSKYKDLMPMMQGYRKNINYRILVDKIQWDFGCCGDTSYRDWFRMDWQGTEEPRKRIGRGVLVARDSVPISCCKAGSTTPCEHRDLMVYGARSIYHCGCRRKLRIWSTGFLVVVSLLFLFVAIFELIILGFSRLLQTSARTAIKNGDLECRSVGWVMRRPLCLCGAAGDPESPARSSPDSPKTPKKKSQKEPKKPTEKEPKKPTEKEPKKPTEKDPKKPSHKPEKESHKPSEKPSEKKSKHRWKDSVCALKKGEKPPCADNENTRPCKQKPPKPCGPGKDMPCSTKNRNKKEKKHKDQRKSKSCSPRKCEDIKQEKIKKMGDKAPKWTREKCKTSTCSGSSAKSTRKSKKKPSETRGSSSERKTKESKQSPTKKKELSKKDRKKRHDECIRKQKSGKGVKSCSSGSKGSKSKSCVNILLTSSATTNSLLDPLRTSTSETGSLLEGQLQQQRPNCRSEYILKTSSSFPWRWLGSRKTTSEATDRILRRMDRLQDVAAGYLSNATEETVSKAEEVSSSGAPVALQWSEFVNRTQDAATLIPSLHTELLPSTSYRADTIQSTAHIQK